MWTCEAALARGLGPAAQGFGDAPGLGDAAAGGVGLAGVEDFADGADARLAEVIDETLQQFASAGEIVGMQLEPGVDVRPDQPAPNRSLMIGGVAGPQIAAVDFFIVGMAGRK